MKDTTNSSKTRLNNRYVALTAILASLITIMTAYICHIPVPIAGGYMHLGDSLIFLAATLLPTPYACAAAAIGGGLADLLTAPMWTVPTLIIKALIALPFTHKNAKILSPRNMIAPLFAYLISGTGYFLANSLVFHSSVAFLTSFGASAIQSFGSAVVFYILAVLLDKAGFKQQMNL